jgi:hypothetical protein
VTATATRPAHITLGGERFNDWKVICESCKKSRIRPIRSLYIGGLGLQLCAECVDELKAALAAD